MQRNGVVILASVALAAVAIIVVAYFFTHKAEPEGPDYFEQNAQRNHEAEVACLEGGGSWVAGEDAQGLPTMTGYCEHSNVESAAPAAPDAPAVEAPSTSDGGGSLNSQLADSMVDHNFNQAEIARFCFAVEQVGYDAALRAFKSAYTVQKVVSPQAVFREIVSRCP